MSDVAISGGGLSGPLLAVFLARRGHRVTVYERRDDPRQALSQGRSINLALSTRGITALEKVGLVDSVMSAGIAMHGRMIHDARGKQDFQSYSADGSKAINSISRSTLNNVLLGAAEQEPNVSLLFGHRILATAHDSGEVSYEANGESFRRTHDVIIGTDGAFSATRDAVVRADRADFSQEYLPWGYKELSISPDPSGAFALDPDALHIWPRGNAMIIALPNPDHSFTATLFWPFDGPCGFADPRTIAQHFAEVYPDLVPLLGDLQGEFERHPVGSLVTVRMWPWTRGRIGLLGDAAHAIVPFFGQGMNCSFEDVVELDRCLDETSDNWAEALPLYAERRKPHADAIGELALANFVEMRDKVSSTMFKARKNVEHALERLAPDHFDSLYELVSFSNVPYAETRTRTAQQRRFPYNVVAVAAAAKALVTGSHR